MKCPNCKKELDVPEYVYTNVTTYREVRKVRTDCCDTVIYLQPDLRVKPLKCDYQGEDDWGR